MININLTNKPKVPYTEIWSYDPGGTTGFAKLRVTLETRTIEIVELGEFTTWSLLDAHTHVIASRPHACLVYEGFTVRTLNANLIPVEVIGIIRFLCINKQVPHFCQAPHERLVVDKWFKKTMMDFPSHYGSATRHGIFFATKHMLEEKLPKLVYNKAQLMKTLIKK